MSSSQLLASGVCLVVYPPRGSKHEITLLCAVGQMLLCLEQELNACASPSEHIMPLCSGSRLGASDLSKQL
eukprot:6475776-Amphidinium_carterae.1